MKNLTVGELKEALKDVPNDVIVRLTSDTGVDQGQCGGKIVIEDAYYTHYTVEDAYYDDTVGEYIVNSFDIYVNEEEVE